MKLITLVLFLFIAGCTDAEWDSQIADYSEAHTVDCYSGGQKIFEATSTGKVMNLEGGGWAFRTTDGRFVKTFADCFVWFKK